MRPIGISGILILKEVEERITYKVKSSSLLTLRVEKQNKTNRFNDCLIKFMIRLHVAYWYIYRILSNWGCFLKD